MSRDLSVKITAEDGASKTFAAVAGSADAMGKSLEAVGKQGGAGVKSLAQQFKSLDTEINTVSKAMTGIGAVITASLAVPLAAGTKAAWNQVDAVQQATVALRAYEKDADKVNRVLSDLVKYARSDMGVLFQREDLFQAAQSLRVMGAETENLTRYVEVMSRSVGVGAGTWLELEQVIGRVGSTGQLTGVEFDNLTKMGFQLDDSLRNSVVTWEELFDALDRGIPADAMLGQVDTIQGGIIRLQSAIRSLGVEFLQIDKDTSQFIEGGLGDQLAQGLGQARDVIISLQPAMAAFGQFAATMASGVGTVVDAFLALPQPVQTTIAAFTGLSGVALTAGGAFLFILPKILEVRAALQTIGGVAGVARLALAGFASPIGIATVAIAGLALGANEMFRLFREGEKSTKALGEAMESLAEVQKQLRLDHQDAAAESVELFALQANGIADMADRYRHSQRLVDDANKAAMESGRSYLDEIDLLQQAYTRNSDEAIAFAAAQKSIGDAFRDQRVDQAALGSELDSLFNQYIAHQITLDEYDAALIDISQNIDRFRVSTEEATASATGLGAAFNLLQGEAKGLLDQIQNLNAIGDDDSFATKLMKTLGLDASQRGQFDTVLGQIKQLNTELTDMPGPGAEQSEWLEWVNQAAAGTIEHQRRIEQANAARAAESQSLALSTAGQGAYNTAVEAANKALEDQAAAQALAAAYTDAHTDTLDGAAKATQEFLERQQELVEQLMAVAGIDDPLSRMAAQDAARQLSDGWDGVATVVTDAQSAISAAASIMSGDMERTSVSAVQLANSIVDAASGLETTFRVIVGNTNAIASQVDGVEKWATELINVAGEYGKIDDLRNAGLITQQQYNDAQAAYNEIASSNADIQNYILEIQTAQAPLIADQTAALENQLETLTTLPAEQQLVALGWMDATTAGRAMEIQTLAIAAASGQIPQDTFDSMITGAAQADPALRAVLESMGLIKSTADGGFEVTIDGLDDATLGTDDLIASIDALTVALGGVPPLRIDAGEANDTVDAIIGTLDDIANNPVTIPVNIDFGGMGEGAAGSAIGLAQSALGQVGRSGQSVSIQVDAVDNASPVIDTVESSLAGLADQDATVTINAIDNASPTIGDVISFAAQVNGYPADLNITATDGASAVIGDAVSFLASIDGYTGTLLVQADDTASGTIGNAVSFLSSVDGYTGTLVVDAVDNASAVIGDAVRFLSSVDGLSSTMYINTVARTIGATARHGGIPGYAHGGVLFEGGEAGPEVAHFAHGGTALLPEHALYMAPPNTYISPANANSGAGQRPLVFDFSGATFGGGSAEQIRSVFEREIVPTIVNALAEQDRGQGL